MLLCDAAQSVGGKLYILGGGWSQLQVPEGGALTVALAMKVTIPWDRSNERIPLRVVLVTDQGSPVNLGGMDVEARTDLEVGRPPGLTRGTPLDANLALNFVGLPLPAGGYAWLCEVDGSPKARTPFRVHPA